MEQQIAPNPIISFLPIILMGVIFGAFLMPLARRKGVHIILPVILMPIPFVNIGFLAWLGSKVDVEVKALREKVESLEKALKDKGLI